MNRTHKCKSQCVKPHHDEHRTRAAILAALLTVLAIPWAAADDGAAPDTAARGPIIELESRVTGNREQPQVFYLVPWQTPESPEILYDPLSSQLEQVFGHLERDELRRQLTETQPQSVTTRPTNQ